jgi:hypothetical protein
MWWIQRRGHNPLHGLSVYFSTIPQNLKVCLTQRHKEKKGAKKNFNLNNFAAEQDSKDLMDWQDGLLWIFIGLNLHGFVSLQDIL